MLSHCWVGIFWITAFYQMYLFQIFFQVCGLACLCLHSFYKVAIFHFNEIQSISYFFHGLSLWWWYLKVITIPRSSRFSPVLHSRMLWFAVPHLSLILFEWIFISAVGRCLDWLFLHADVQYHLLKRLFLFYCVTFAPLSQVS